MQEKGGYRLRALSVVENLRGKGYGLQLLRAAEILAQENNARYLWANARIHVKEFYARAGYSIGEDEFIVEGVGPHVIVSCRFGGQE